MMPEVLFSIKRNTCQIEIANQNIANPVIYPLIRGKFPMTGSVRIQCQVMENKPVKNAAGNQNAQPDCQWQLLVKVREYQQ